MRRLDPLIEAAREAGRGLSRFGEHGDLLDSWIAPIFDDEPAEARIRLAACLLADVAWQAHPDFRAERGRRDGAARQLGGCRCARPARSPWRRRSSPISAAAAPFPSRGWRRSVRPAMLERAYRWGLAMRLGQRLSGGLASAARTQPPVAPRGRRPPYASQRARRRSTVRRWRGGWNGSPAPWAARPELKVR